MKTISNPTWMLSFALVCFACDEDDASTGDTTNATSDGLPATDTTGSGQDASSTGEPDTGSTTSVGGETTAPVDADTGGSEATGDSITCDAEVACEPCLQCAAATDCSAETAQCQAGSPCNAMLMCVQPCTELATQEEQQACLGQCANENPEGVQPFMAFATCLTGACPTACAEQANQAPAWQLALPISAS